ncbi:endonuclease/exonuclease/phosphatase family protein [Paenibacillus faecalis]|uniref:endonuclease/exonuclease/phosphatase family protein n=1 Tax=Paenibacillus faecalis TaxID=2079532 RepID=UPI000D0F6FBA|nr:endonuclease/exonuclease/phosphatase family protein [Paenibacillus faecalis]
MSITAMTFNLRVDVPADGVNAWPYRKHRAAAVITASSPDIVGTQEGTSAMLQDLDEAMPEYKRIGSGRLGEGNHPGDEHCAIYYKHAELALLEEGQFWLSETSSVPGSKSWDSSLPRICTWARFQKKNHAEIEFYVLNTHFDHIGVIARQKSAQLILKQIDQFRQGKRIPIILMGDFNASPDQPEINMLRQQLQDVYTTLSEPVGSTFHDFKGGNEGDPIDYIFTSQDVSLTEVRIHRNQIDGGYPSDHYALSVILNPTTP